MDRRKAGFQADDNKVKRENEFGLISIKKSDAAERTQSEIMKGGP